MNSSYIGRFAPSPTGKLHLGSLYTAVASYLDAKANNGKWLIRIEDIDPPREEAGANEAIIDALNAHGLIADEPISYQSQHSADYEQAISHLLAQQQAYYCSCSRKDLQGLQGYYHGQCRGKSQCSKPSAIRLLVEQRQQSFNDLLLGRIENPALAKGTVDDFIIKRKDGLYAYQLAVVVDDIAQGISHVVRGQDLLSCTFKQLALFKQLDAQAPRYLHLPLLTKNQQKLSKQNHATAINPNSASDNLQLVLKLLGQDTPKHYRQCSDILQYASEHWQLEHNSRAANIEI
jgi:glutamyl-Q tRNA(Asp) synthetase